MDLLSIASNLLGTVAPSIVGSLAGPQAGAVVQLLSDNLLGHKNGTAYDVSQALRVATPDQIEKLRQIDSNLELELARVEAQDKANARELQKIALSSNDKFINRFIYYFAWFWSLLSGVYFFAVTFVGVGETGQHFADVILGFLLGTIVATIISFFYGSSASSKAKTDMAAKQGMKL